MKQTKLWLITIAALLCSITANAHNFEVGGIYYNITSSTDLTVAVTCRGSSYDSYSNEYSGAVTIPETVTYNNNTYSVTSIGSYAFRSCSSLTAITLPEGVTSIGSSAFYDCWSLTAITIPEGVTSIREYAFYGCRSLADITIPESVTSIGSAAFYGCRSLADITIPEGVTSIGSHAFYNCSSLTAIIVDENNLVYDSRENCNAIIETSSNTLIQGCSATLIPEGVTSIGSSAFHGYSSLTAITIPEGVTSIGSSAFSDCRSLTDISIPEGVTRIGEDAFSGCSSLADITIPESVTSIGSSAFYGCRSLYKVFNCSNLSLSKGSSNYGYVAYYAKVVYQGSKLTIVGDYQFYTSNGIYSLVNYIGDDTEIVLPDSYNGENYKIGDCAFSGCSSLTSVTLPEGVTSIGNYAFYDCSSLTAINIPEGVTSIGYETFVGCISLTTITIPEGVTSIGWRAFSGCSSLLDIYCYAENTPSTDSDAFDNSNISNATLHVPANALDAYKTSYPWSSFGTIVALTEEEMSTEKSEIRNEKSEIIYDLQGRRVENPVSGLYIINGKKVVIK